MISYVFFVSSFQDHHNIFTIEKLMDLFVLLGLSNSTFENTRGFKFLNKEPIKLFMYKNEQLYCPKLRRKI